jgi:hypothetical protein
MQCYRVVGLGDVTVCLGCTMQIHNVELRPGKGGQMARSAGTSATLIARGNPSSLLHTVMSSIPCSAVPKRIGQDSLLFDHHYVQRLPWRLYVHVLLRRRRAALNMK